MSKIYDIIIIGAGTAGLSAAIYGQRGGKSTILFEEMSYGGQIVNTPEVENYPGIKKTSGFQFAQGLYEQATDLGAEIRYEKVVEIIDKGELKAVKTSQGEYDGRTVIVATGAKARPLGLSEEERYVGAGLSYCATCDGAFFRGKTVAVIGGGNTALEDAQVLSELAKKVYLVHRRDEFRGEDANIERLKNRDNVEFVLSYEPVEIKGSPLVSELVLRSKKTGELRSLEVNGVFVAIGTMPKNEDFAKVVKLDEGGYVIGDEDCHTNAKGIFVAGDCRTKKVRQLTTAASDGAVAALAAIEYINR